MKKLFNLILSVFLVALISGCGSDAPAYKVNWESVNKDFKAELMNKTHYPYVIDVSSTVNQNEKKITLTAVVSDATKPAAALDLADIMIRRYGSLTSQQDDKIKSPTKNYYGGIYDDYTVQVGIAPQSKIDNPKQWFVYSVISPKMHTKQAPKLQN